MQVYNFATYTRSLSCEYQSDVDFAFRGNKSNNQQGIDVYLHNSMLSARDARINNYSALVVSNDIAASDAFILSDIEAPVKRVISTYLAISITNEINADTRYLYFNNNRETDSPDFTQYTSQQMLKQVDIIEDSQRYFNIELIDGQYARINFNFNNVNYYLAANNQSDLLFVAGPEYVDFTSLNFNFVDETIFYYILDEASDTMFFLKPLPGGITKSLGVADNSSTKLQLLTALSPDNYFAFNNFNFKIRANANHATQKLNTSWTAYDTNNINGLSVDDTKTHYDLTNNILIASQYAEADYQRVPAKPIILKNQSSIMSRMDQASYTDLQNGEPGTQLRQYTAAFTGNEQERGNDSITLNYVTYTNDYIIKPDSYSIFKTSGDLYPYSQLNINDSTLASDGALAGNSPYTSDQLFMQKNNAQGADGQYLCTWLSAGPSNTKGIWVDRYYNTNKISLLDAAKAVNDNYGAYNNFVQSYVSSNNITADFFDKTSDFVFEPSKEYFYYRMGNRRVDQHIDTYSNNLILSALSWTTSNSQTIKTNDSYVCDGASYATFANYSPINDASQMTFSVWLDCDNWQNISGHEVLGNLTNTGFGLINDPVITPLLLVQSASALHTFNSDFVEITTTLLSAVQFITRTDALDGFQTIDTQGNMYKLLMDATVYDKKTFDRKFIACTNDSRNIYLLHNDGTTVTAFDTQTEQLSTINVDAGSRSICVIDGTAYGTIGSKVLPYTDNAVLFLYNDNQIVYKNYSSLDQFISFKTLSGADGIGYIADFTVDSDLNLYVLYNDYKISKFNNERVHQYTTSLESTLSAVGGSNYAIDICYEYVADAKKQSVIVIAHDSSSNLILTKLDDAGQIVTQTSTTIKKSDTAVLNITNAQYLQQQYKNRGKSLDVVIKLANTYSNLDFTTVRYPIDVSQFNSGKHHFAIRIDGHQGNITIFIDGRIVSNSYIGAGKYMQLPLFNTSICVGATQFNNSVTLAQYLRQPKAYFINNVTISSPRLYNASLLDNDIKLLNIQASKVGELCFHLPCGQRNNLDRIKQIFEWRTPGFKSNNIKIVLKNSGATSPQLQQDIKNQIIQDISSTLPMNIDIHSVEFIEFD